MDQLQLLRHHFHQASHEHDRKRHRQQLNLQHGEFRVAQERWQLGHVPYLDWLQSQHREQRHLKLHVDRLQHLQLEELHR